MAKKIISSSITSGLDKANPLNKSIDKNSTSDTGSESTKLGYKTVKSTYRAGKTTVRAGKTVYKTTKKSVRAAKNTAKRTVKATKTTVKTTVQVVKVTVKVATEVVVQTAAALSNPYVLAALAIVIIIVFSSVMITSIISGGGAVATTVTNKAYSSAAGLGIEISEILEQGKAYFDTAAEKQKNEYNALIDSLYYNTGDMPHSDLLYAIASPSGLHLPKAVANPENKEKAKNIYDRSVSELEAIALVYVYLEKQENESNGTEGEIYKVEFTDDVFDELLDNMVSWSDTVEHNEECPEVNCSIHIDEQPNPQYEKTHELYVTAAHAHSDWGEICRLLDHWNGIEDGRGQAQYWSNYVQPALDKWLSDYEDFEKWHITVWYYDYYDRPYEYLQVIGGLYEQYSEELESIPKTIVTKTTTCDHEHDYHYIQLNVVSADDIMTEWGFTDIDKQWYDITYKGLQLTSEAETE